LTRRRGRLSRAARFAFAKGGATMRILAGIVLPFALIAPAAAQGIPLTDAAAKKSIEINWNKLTANLLLGERVVAKDNPDAACSDENISMAQFEFLLDAEKAGYAKISYGKEFRDYSDGKIFSRTEMLTLAASESLNTKIRFTVIPTKKAEQSKISLSVTGRTGCLRFRPGDYTIDKVLKNEPLRKGGKDFRIVTVTYRMTPDPMLREIRAVSTTTFDVSRVANVLIQHNPDRGNWDIAAFDAANKGEGFKTKNVEDYLAKLN
jgi:hypothetical protein